MKTFSTIKSLLLSFSFTLLIISCNKEEFIPTQILNPENNSTNLTHQLIQRSKCGDEIGTYLGTPVYYNDSNCSGYNTFNGYTTGLKWQCVEYVNRLYKSYYGREIRNPSGNANIYYNTSQERNLDAFKNGGTIPPATGDIICSNGGTWGHVAVVSGIEKDSIKVTHQNFGTKAEKKIFRKANNLDPFQLSNPYLPIIGWLRCRPELKLDAISISPNPLKKNFATNGSVTIKNYSKSLGFIGTIYISLHDSKGIWKEDIASFATTINAGSSINKTFTKSKVLSSAGTYQIWVKFQTTGAEIKYPIVNDGKVKNKFSIKII
ncbi:MAG: CHAP domain-containing protein [Saprospiraceae bacterium]|nr:CHAP domain-containing protein [Saprospiraceae bacterium]